MSLNLNWEKVDSARVRTYPFEAGICLMAIGMNKVTQQNLIEAEFRIRTYEATCGKLGFEAKELIGLQSNVSSEPLSRWARRILESLKRGRI